MKIIAGLVGIIFVYFLIIEVFNALKSHRAKKWGNSIGKLTKWNIQNEVDSEDTRIIIKELKYSYEVNGREYESENIGFGFPNGMSVLYVEKTLENILKDSPKLCVYYNPSKPLISVLSVGFKMYHLVKILGYTLILVFLGVVYVQP